MIVAENDMIGRWMSVASRTLGQTDHSLLEITSPIPRKDLIPSLPPFARAQLHLEDLVVQVQQLLQEDLSDLSQPLDECFKLAQTDEELCTVQAALALFEHLIELIP